MNLRADNSSLETAGKLMDAHVDITGAKHVEMMASADRKTIWVNVNGICVLRICKIENLLP